MFGYTNIRFGKILICFNVDSTEYNDSFLDLTVQEVDRFRVSIFQEVRNEEGKRNKNITKKVAEHYEWSGYDEILESILLTPDRFAKILKQARDYWQYLGLPWEE